jgi:putative heme-binding domain-containing protein
MPDAWYLSDEEIANVAAHIRALGKTPGENVPGDPARGASVYARSGCSTCHIHAGQGTGFGPDLTDVGERRNASYIGQAVSNPASALPEGLLMVSVVTSAGRSVNGIRLNEDSFTIQIKDPRGSIYSFRKRDLKELKKETGQTPMPSFEKILSPADLQDLVAFLAVSRETR